MKRVLGILVVAVATGGCSSTRVAQPTPREIRTYPDRITPGVGLYSRSSVLAENSVNSPSIFSAPTLAQPLTANAGTLSAIDSGSASGVGVAEIPPADEAIRNAPTTYRVSVLNTAVNDLPTRVRQALLTGRPESITRLTPERLERFEIGAVNGTVTLHGTVGSETERLMIGQRIAEMEGVRAVNNQLRVLSPTRPGDDEAASAHRIKPGTGN